VGQVLLEVERGMSIVMLWAEVDDDVQGTSHRHDEQPRDHQ
jgi:hypothetical protein